MEKLEEAVLFCGENSVTVTFSSMTVIAEVDHPYYVVAGLGHDLVAAVDNLKQEMVDLDLLI